MKLLNKIVAFFSAMNVTFGTFIALRSQLSRLFLRCTAN